MKLLRAKLENILMAIGFLTKMPIPRSLEFSYERLSSGLVCGPFIGFLIGGILVVSSILSSIYFPSYIVGAIVLTVFLYITGGLHIDGLGDLGDGLFSGKKGVEFYNIMKDSRIGTGGLLSIVFVLFLDYLLLIDNLNWKILLFLPVAGRLGMLLGSIIGKYPENYEGLGKLFIDGRTWKNSFIVLFIILVLFVVAFSWRGVVLYIVIFILSYLLIRNWHHKLEGTTGDMLGALVEYNQLAYLFFAYVLFK